MLKKFLLLAGVCCMSTAALAQSYLLKGIVYNDATKKAIADVTIMYDGHQVRTNVDGSFQLRLSDGEHALSFVHLSFLTLKSKVLIRDDKRQDFYMQAKDQLLEQVTISGAANDQPASYLNNYQLLKKADIEKVPGFLGSPDLIRTLKTLPGFTNSGEGSSALLVRGGSAGQNLMLFNNAAIYNPSHLLGFFSIFNTAVVDEVKVYKSGIPAAYSGRLSSVVDIKSNNSVADSLALQASLSLLAADMSITVPLTSKWSVSAALRQTFMNRTIWPLVNSLNKKSSSFNRLSYDFYDYNLSTAVAISPKDQLFIAGYIGGDKFGFKIDRFGVTNGMDWQNRAASLNWKKSLSAKALLNSTFSYSGYHFNFNLSQEGLNAAIRSEISDLNAASVLQVYTGHHGFKLGLNYTDHRFKPNTPHIESANTTLDYGSPIVYHADETALFLSDDWGITDRLSVYAGARFTYYRHKGPYTADIDSVNNVYGSNKTISDQFFMEPSLTVKYNVRPNTAIKFSFSRNMQSIHLIPVTASNFPTDFWIPATKNRPAEKGIQLSLGLFKDWEKGKYEAYVDLYYKKMTNLIEFSGGMMELIDNLKIEDNTYLGDGEAYGSEFFFKKNSGRLKGYISYTIAKNTRHFAGLNDGASFPFKYDRRNEINFVPDFRLNAKWDLSALFTYSSGNAYTMPVSRYLVAGSVVNEYGKYNGARMPAYHRLDLAANYHFKLKGRYESILSISVYNVYNRLNPIYNYFLFSGDLKKSVKVQKESIALLPVLPAVSYKVYFKK